MRLVIRREKKQGGISWLITRPIIDEIKQRYDIDQEPKNTPSDITSFSSEMAENSVQEQNFTNTSELTDVPELSDAKTDLPKEETKSELTDVTELSKNNTSSVGSESSENGD